VNRPQPPALATWLMSTLLLGDNAEALIGDLIEQHRRGRSSAWYSRQAARAIVTTFAAEMWQQQLLAIVAIGLGTYFGQIYMFIVRPSWVAELDRLWYPYLISSRWSWMVINPWAYRLQLYSLTGRVVYCAFLLAVVWILCRLHPRQRGLLATLFCVTQIGLCMPALRTGLTTWLHEPGNPIWFFSLLWFSLFTFVAIPFSIHAGIRLGKPLT
jgi:hypothetical protein